MTVGALVEMPCGVSGDTPRRNARFRIATGPADWPARGQYAAPTWRELAAAEQPADFSTVRIQAPDLRSAARAAEAARQSATSQGRRASVMIDIEVLIDDDATIACRHLADLEGASDRPHRPSSLFYVGTARGLVSLLADIQVLDIADGVTLLTLHASDAERRIADELMPLLEQKGLVSSQHP